jgi:hypothetical protein
MYLHTRLIITRVHVTLSDEVTSKDAVLRSQAHPQNCGCCGEDAEANSTSTRPPITLE